MLNRCILSYLIAAFIVISILVCGDKMHIYLEKEFYICDIRITGWNITHFLSNFVIGLLCPNRHLFWITGGILWEVFEFSYGYFTDRLKFWTSGGINGQIMDIICNILGYTLGNYIKI